MPTMLEVSYNWVDIKEEFFKATRDLDLGELLHDESFGLFEAMSAIEMMDPKMDVGMMCNRGKKVLNFDQSIKAGILKLDNLTTEEIVGIFDSIFACLVTWLEGHSAAQTILTCLYLHKPLSIVDRAMRAFSIHMLKLIALVNAIVMTAGVVDEEDFQVALYGYSTLPEVTETRSSGMMKEVEEELQRAVRSSRNKQGETWDPKTQKQHEDAVALFSRIRFLRLFYSGLSAILRKDATSVQEADRCMASCTELVDIMQNTVSRGVKRIHRDSTVKDEHPVVMGFEPLVNQRLLPPTFPRYTKLHSRKEAMVYLEQTVSRIKYCVKIHHCTQFQSSLDYVEKFGDSNPCVLTRCILQLMYQIGWKDHSMQDVLREAGRIFICPPALIPKAPVMNNLEAKRYVDSFFTQCVNHFEALVVLNGHNTARQRDRIGMLLEDFSVLQDSADKVDAFLHNVLLKSDQPRPHLAYLGTWVLFHTLKLMIKYLLSGFVLELYAEHEFIYIYWYLHEFAYVWLVSALSRADAMLLEQEGHESKSKSKAKSKRKIKKHRPYGRDINFYTGLQHVCGGFYKAVTGLKVAGKLKVPLPAFDKERLRYEHRFRPFRVVNTPPPVPYEQFQLMTDFSNYQEAVTCASFYHEARNNFFKARSFFEAIPNPSNEVLNLIKVVKTNFIVLRILEGGHKCDLSPTFDFSLHSCFPVIKL